MMLSVSDIDVTISGAPILRSLSCRIPSAGFSVLAGPNGSGKSTLLAALTGYRKLSRGAVYYDDIPLAKLSTREIARRVAALEQEPYLGFEFTVFELVSCGRIPHRGRLAPWSRHDDECVENALAATELSELRNRVVHTLSGGERQRTFLALALAQEPETLLLDEPTAHLDLRHQLDVLNRVRDISRSGTTVLAAIHDLNLAIRYADHLIVLNQGTVHAQGTPESLLSTELIRTVWGVDVELHRSERGIQVFPR